MSNNKFKPKKLKPDAKPLHVALFRSRNKDNKHLPNFSERAKSFLTRKDPSELIDDFMSFCSQGKPGELSRFYYSVNARDDDLIRKNLLHALIDTDNIDMATIAQLATSIAAHKECAAESHWLLDIDDDKIDIDTVIAKIKLLAKHDKKPNHVEVIDTINGHHLIVDHGFDIRRIEKFGVTSDMLKRDGLTLIAWSQNPE